MFFTPKNMISSMLNQRASTILSQNMYSIQKRTSDSALNLFSIDKYVIIQELSGKFNSLTFLDNAFNANLNLAPAQLAGVEVSKPEAFSFMDLLSTQYIVPLLVPLSVFGILIWQFTKSTDTKGDKPQLPATKAARDKELSQRFNNLEKTLNPAGAGGLGGELGDIKSQLDAMKSQMGSLGEGLGGLGGRAGNRGNQIDTGRGPVKRRMNRGDSDEDLSEID